MHVQRRLPTLETLEPRELFAADWQNGINRFDANASGVVEPTDALMVINDINLHGIRTLGSRGTQTGRFVDVDGDGSVSSLDVLLIINSINRLEVGTLAPNVRLPNQDGQQIDLRDHLGQSAVVLYFYPKDNTPGCTVEALDFSARKDQIEQLGAKLYGISLDSVGSHNDFSDTHQLRFDILADEKMTVTTAFGALSEVGGSPIAKRTTFIIGSDGVIRKVFKDVDVLIHGEEVVAALQAGVHTKPPMPDGPPSECGCQS